MKTQRILALTGAFIVAIAATAVGAGQKEESGMDWRVIANNGDTIPGHDHGPPSIQQGDEVV